MVAKDQIAPRRGVVKIVSYDIRPLLALVFNIAGLVLVGCGGGSIGTGTGDGLTTVEGRLVSPEGLPLPGFAVTIAGSETASITDQSGYFVLAVPTETITQSVEIHVSPDGTNQSNVTVEEVASNPSAVVVEVVVDEIAPPVLTKSTNLTVQAIGDCALSFNNNRTIDQIMPISEGTTCSFSVEVLTDGILRNDAVYRIESRACDDNSEWTTIQEGITASELSPTLGIANILYNVDGQHCVYRVIAPIGEASIESASFEIRTLLKLSYDSPPVIAEPAPEQELPTPSPTPTEEPASESETNTTGPVEMTSQKH